MKENKSLNDGISIISQVMREVSPKRFPDSRSIGQRVSSLRQHQKMTQQELANMLERSSGYHEVCPFISRAYISNIECGHNVPSLELLTDIAKALECTRAYLLGEDQEWFSLSDEEKQIIIVFRSLKEAGIVLY